MSNNPDAPLVETVSKRSPFGALLSRTLPNYKGPYPVGHRKLTDAPAGLAMDTVLFSVFYPTGDDVSSKDRVVWFPHLEQTVNGFLRMAHRTPNFIYRAISYPIAAAAIYGTTFPAISNAPLRSSPEQSKWPLVIFSHGVGCSRLMYSSFCGEMASRGYVVCAIEHRDGTSPSSTIVTEDGKKRNLDWLQWSDLVWPELDVQPVDDTILRHEQIKFRVAEIYEVVKVMGRLSKGENLTRTSVHSPDFDWRRWSSIDASKPIMTGHSLGGSAALAAGVDSRFDFASIAAFDPALQRLDPWSSNTSVPLLVIGSEEWMKTDDYPRLKNLVKFAKSSDVFSIVGSTHPALSDVFLILPTSINRMTGLKTTPERVIDLSTKTVLEFLLGNVQRMKSVAKTVEGQGGREKNGDFLYHNL